MPGLTNEVDQNCTIADLKGNFIFCARHVAVLIANLVLMKQSC